MLKVDLFQKEPSLTAIMTCFSCLKRMVLRNRSPQKTIFITSKTSWQFLSLKIQNIYTSLLLPKFTMVIDSIFNKLILILHLVLLPKQPLIDCDDTCLEFITKFVMWPEQVTFLIHGVFDRLHADNTYCYLTAPAPNMCEDNPNNPSNYTTLSGLYIQILHTSVN